MAALCAAAPAAAVIRCVQGKLISHSNQTSSFNLFLMEEFYLVQLFILRAKFDGRRICLRHCVYRSTLEVWTEPDWLFYVLRWWSGTQRYCADLRGLWAAEEGHSAGGVCLCSEIGFTLVPFSLSIRLHKAAPSSEEGSCWLKYCFVALRADPSLPLWESLSCLSDIVSVCVFVYVDAVVVGVRLAPQSCYRVGLVGRQPGRPQRARQCQSVCRSMLGCAGRLCCSVL